MNGLMDQWINGVLSEGSVLNAEYGMRNAGPGSAAFRPPKCGLAEGQLLLGGAGNSVFKRPEGRAPGLMFKVAVILISVALLSLAGRVAAHDGPEDVIATLTQRMSKAGKTPGLLIRRASEFKAIGKMEEAAADLVEATKLDPKNASAYAELSKVQFAQEKFVAACDNATRSLALMEDGADRGPVYLLRAQIQTARGRTAEALADCEFADRKDDIDWYLVRSQVQAELGKFSERAEGLKSGYDRNGSIVLEIEWVEAMIDAGQFHPALERIEQHLNRLRFRSSWLLRRARASKGLGRDYQADTRAALDEITHRLNPNQPEPTLLLDRATAFALLGKADEAKRDLVEAKKRGIPASSCQRVENILKASLVASGSSSANGR
jgi:tetratricopeptide (TPR) repeat protein